VLFPSKLENEAQTQPTIQFFFVAPTEAKLSGLLLKLTATNVEVFEVSPKGLQESSIEFVFSLSAKDE
jgi:hypothetical protein